MRFIDLQNRVRQWRGIASGDEDANTTTWIKETINSAYKELLSQDDFPTTVKEFVLELSTPFNDGALSVTQGLSAAALTFTSTFTGFTPNVWGGKAQTSAQNQYYEVIETSLGSTTPNLVYFDRPYSGAGSSSIAYNIYIDLYPLPSDLRKLENVRLGGANGRDLTIRDSSKHDQLHPHSLRSTPAGDPLSVSIWRRHNTAWFTATATFTNGSDLVTLQEERWYYGIDNWRFRTVEDASGERYRIQYEFQTSTTAPVVLKMDRAYGGTSATGTAVNIDPAGTPMLQVWPPPTSANQLIIKYLSSDHDMVNDADTPHLIHDAHHDAIWKLAIYNMAQFDEDIPTDRLQFYKLDVNEAKARLESYRQMERGQPVQRQMYRSRRVFSGFRIPATVTGT